MTEVARLALPLPGQMYPMNSQSMRAWMRLRASRSRPKNRMAVCYLRAIASHAAVLADLDRTRDDFNLLDDPRQLVAHLNVTAAIRASRPGILPRLVDLVEGKGRSLVTRVSRLGSLLALAFSLGGRLWRLDNVAGRWLGRGGRILLGTSELGFELFLARGELGDLLLELSTLWATARIGIVHDENKLPADAKSAKSNHKGRERLLVSFLHPVPERSIQ